MSKLENYKTDISLIKNVNQGDNKLPHDNEAEEIESSTSTSLESVENFEVSLPRREKKRNTG